MTEQTGHRPGTPVRERPPTHTLTHTQGRGAEPSLRSPAPAGLCHKLGKVFIVHAALLFSQSLFGNSAHVLGVRKLSAE